MPRPAKTTVPVPPSVWLSLKYRYPYVLLSPSAFEAVPSSVKPSSTNEWALLPANW